MYSNPNKVNENCLFNCSYKSPSQNHQQLDSFFCDFNNLLNKITNSEPVCSVIAGDFTAKCLKWYSREKINTAGLEIDAD